MADRWTDEDLADLIERLEAVVIPEPYVPTRDTMVDAAAALRSLQEERDAYLPIIEAARRLMPHSPEDRHWAPPSVRRRSDYSCALCEIAKAFSSLPAPSTEGRGEHG